MNYHDIYECDVNNGKGARVTLFVSGCDHGCKGCYNVKTWPVNSGNKFTKEHEDRIIELLQDEKMVRQGLSLQGGDPLHSANLESVHRLITRVRKECPGKDIWMWTGFTLLELSEDEHSLRYKIATSVDVLIDGKFVQEEHEPGLLWRGSKNQLIHNWSASSF